MHPNRAGLRLRRTAVALAAAVWLYAASPASGQCPMCRAAAAAQRPEAAKAFNLAIIVMFIPALAMFSSVILLSFRYRNSPTAEDADDRQTRAAGVSAGRRGDETDGFQ